MNLTETLLWTLAALVAVYLGVRIAQAVGAYFALRGERIITCPETHRPAAVEVAAGKAALKTFTGTQSVRLKDCSRWPEKRNCDQACLHQIEESPGECLVWNIVTRWYEGKSCAYCKRPFGHINWHEHRPALKGPDGKTVQWTEVEAQHLPDVLATHQPVCWDCHIAESLRRQHPELVTDRESHTTHYVN
jgi:hypothetical protein